MTEFVQNNNNNNTDFQHITSGNTIVDRIKHLDMFSRVLKTLLNFMDI